LPEAGRRGRDCLDGGQDFQSEAPTRHVSDCQAERCRSRPPDGRSESDCRRDDSVLPRRYGGTVGHPVAKPQFDVGVANAGALIVIAGSDPDSLAYDADAFTHVADPNTDVPCPFTDVAGPHAIAYVSEANAITNIIETAVVPADSDSSPESQANDQATAIAQPGSEPAA
jgi:hypothetical protein